MQQKDILETFKKYVGEFGLDQKFQVPLCKAQRIQNFGEDIKSANELAGALQTLQIALKKMLDISGGLQDEGGLAARAESTHSAESAHIAKSAPIDKNARNLAIHQIQQKIAECRFMGSDLFGAVLSAKVGAQSIEFDNPSPMPLLERGDVSGFVGYVQDKLSEISEKLGVISEAITQERLFGKKEVVVSDVVDFDPNVFKKMF
ncbi:hypothetical protein BKN38_00360 [Helicobacter sp. CLO-3]|uniref:flagellar FLiS export co-chaperone n=1 Tax=unclassified Helicobacter TaxID=2593540 RepID=UPI00080513FB|nr:MULTISPECIES: flagellar FLiS export co-chaperone [unclassified Helicobacter]OBV30011.1 hypothetical protein BA723_03035 [Helicobacter sp. CLO-3]OHU85888.1 hypothetical protein BKN38_00360 [Helicobacter sp. CLO-3]